MWEMTIIAKALVGKQKMGSDDRDGAVRRVTRTRPHMGNQPQGNRSRNSG